MAQAKTLTETTENQQTATTEEVAENQKTIFVISALPPANDGGAVVALHEIDERHPNGEILIAGDKPKEVFETAAVGSLLAKGVLKKVQKKK